MNILNYKKKKIINDYINKKDFNIPYDILSSCSDKKKFDYLSVNSNLLGHLVHHLDAWNLSKEDFNKRLYTIRLAMDNSKYSKALLLSEIKTNDDINIIGIELAEKLSIFLKRFNETRSHNEFFYEVNQLSSEIRQNFSNNHLLFFNHIFNHQKNSLFEYWSNVLINYRNKEQYYSFQTLSDFLYLLQHFDKEENNFIINNVLYLYDKKINKTIANNEFLDLYSFNIYHPVDENVTLTMDYKILELVEAVKDNNNKDQEQKLVNLIYNHFHKNWDIIESEKDNLGKEQLFSLRKNNLEGILYFLEKMNNKDDIINKSLTVDKINYISQLVNNQYFGDNLELSYKQICDKGFFDLIIKMEEVYIKNDLNKNGQFKSKSPRIL